jgi:hypothetical protein
MNILFAENYSFIILYYDFPNARVMTTTVKYQDGEKVPVLSHEN